MYDRYATDVMDSLEDEMEEFELDEFEGEELEEEFEGFEEEEFDSFLEEEIDEALDYGVTPRPGRPPGLRPRPPVVLPPITITVRPAFVLDRFVTNSPEVRPHHRPLILRAARAIVASWRVRRPITTIRLVGHTDSRGPAAYNIGLGRRRAQSVRRELRLAIARLNPLLARRIRFVVQSLGESRPAASNATPAGQARNRRVQVFFVRRGP